MIVAIFLSLFFAGAPQANKNDEPLVSATNPTYLSCMFWTGKEWSKPAARSARTPVVRSAKGFLAYAEVKVVVHDEDCENTSTLYVASSEGNEFKIVYEKKPSESRGNGIRVIGWSPSGDRLLAEVTVWSYNSDAGFEYIPVIYDLATASGKEISELDKALIRHFGSNCGFEHKTTRWKTNQQILVKVSPPIGTEDPEEYFCVKQPKLFLYDLQSNSLMPFPPHPSKSD